MISIDFSKKPERGSLSFLISKDEIDSIMAKEAFEQRLREFFETYDEKKLKIVPKIAKKLHRHEELIMNHLHKKYQTGQARDMTEEELREEDRQRREKENGGSESAESQEEAEAEESEEEGEADEESAEASDEGGEEDEEESKKED